MKLEPGLSKLVDPAPAPFLPAGVGNPGTIRAEPPPPEVNDEEAARMFPIPPLDGASLRGAAVAEGMEVCRDGDEMRLLLLLLLGGLGTPGLLIPAAVASAGVAVSGFGVGGGPTGCGRAGGGGADNSRRQQ